MCLQLPATLSTIPSTTGAKDWVKDRAPLKQHSHCSIQVGIGSLVVLEKPFPLAEDDPFSTLVGAAAPSAGHVTYDYGAAAVFRNTSAGQASATLGAAATIQRSDGTELAIRALASANLPRCMVNMFFCEPRDHVHFDSLAVSELSIGAAGAVVPLELSAPVLGSNSVQDFSFMDRTVVLHTEGSETVQPTYFGGPLLVRGHDEGRQNIGEVGRITAVFPTQADAVGLPPLALTLERAIDLAFPAATVAAVMGGGAAGDAEAMAAAGGAGALPIVGVADGDGEGAAHINAAQVVAAILCPIHALHVVEGASAETVVSLFRRRVRGFHLFDQHVRRAKAGQTPLARACRMGTAAVVERLMRYYREEVAGGRLSQQDRVDIVYAVNLDDGGKAFETAFTMACNPWERQYQIAWLLLAMGYIPTEHDHMVLRKKLDSFERRGRHELAASLREFIEQVDTYVATQLASNANAAEFMPFL